MPRPSYQGGGEGVGKMAGGSLQIIFVKEFALIALFAETAQPVLADETVERVVDLVFVRAVLAQRTMSLAEGLAYGAIGVEAEPVFSFEEVGEGEVEGWRCVVWRIWRQG